MRKYFKLGKKVYGCKKILDYRKVAVFVVRSLINKNELDALDDFFGKNSLRKAILKKNPVLFASLTRQVFFEKSTIGNRIKLIEGHFTILEDILKQDVIEKLYVSGEKIRVFHEVQNGHDIEVFLAWVDSEHKEGLLSLVLCFDSERIYHVNFTAFAREKGNESFLIGSLQGSKGGLAINKMMTKCYFGYRPKNLIFYVLRIIAQRLDIKNIYAVSNKGFYANNHLRSDRKLKTSLDDFWLECDGVPVEPDERFFAIPVIEHRKTIEEVATHKRNLYRKRFAALDKVQGEVTQALDFCIK